MINSFLLIIALTGQLSMDGIIRERSISAASVQVKIVTQPVYIYVYTDKFGVEHTDQIREKAQIDCSEANKKPFQMKDNNGVTWEHQDINYLHSWIEQRNRHLKFQPILIHGVGFYAQKPQCGPVG